MAAVTPPPGVGSHRTSSRRVDTPSGLSSWLLCPAPPVSTPTRPGLPARGVPRSRGATTCPPLPRSSVSTTRPTSRAPGDHPGGWSDSQVSSNRPSVGRVARGSPPATPPYVPGSRPGIVSEGPACHRVVRFRGAETRSAPLPLSDAFSRLGLAPPTDLTGKPLRASLWFSFSRPPDLPEVPGSGRDPAPPVTRPRAPHASAVERA